MLKREKFRKYFSKIVLNLSNKTGKNRVDDDKLYGWMVESVHES